MDRGIKIKEIAIGTGKTIAPDKLIVANVRFFLNRGTELTTIGGKIFTNLKDRDCIAGLRYGIEGMRLGGKRRIKISPHLAYGAEGVPGLIPPNAVIHCEVEILDIRERGVIKPNDIPPGRHLFVFRPGESARNQSRWQFGLDDDGRCGIFISYPIPGMTWRHTRQSNREALLDPETTRKIFESAFSIPLSYPKDCFKLEELYSDTSEKGNNITRHRVNDIACLSISITERGQWLLNVNLAETSNAIQESPLFEMIHSLLENPGSSGVVRA